VLKCKANEKWRSTMKIIYPFGREKFRHDMRDAAAGYVRCRCSSTVLFAAGQNNASNNYCACSDEDGRAGSRVNAG
jgi:hypothetical protein